MPYIIFFNRKKTLINRSAAEKKSAPVLRFNRFFNCRSTADFVFPIYKVFKMWNCLIPLWQKNPVVGALYGAARVMPSFRTRFLIAQHINECSSNKWHPKGCNLSSPKPGHRTGGSGRQGAGRTAGRGDAGQNKVPTLRWPWKPTAPLALQRTVNNCSERLFASTNKGNPMETVEGTKRPVDPRFISGLSPVYHRDRERSSLQAVDQCTDAYLFL